MIAGAGVVVWSAGWLLATSSTCCFDGVKPHEALGGSFVLGNGFLDLWFGNGWWSAGLLLTCLVGFGVPYVLAASVGRVGIKRDVMLMVLAFAGPFVGFVYASILGAVADPDPGCTQECWDRLGLLLLAALGFVMWEIGLAA